MVKPRDEPGRRTSRSEPAAAEGGSVAPATRNGGSQAADPALDTATDPATETDLARRIAAEQLRLVWAHCSISFFVGGAFAIVLSLLLLESGAPLSIVGAWLAAKVLIGFYPVWLAWRAEGVAGRDAQRRSDRALTLAWLVVDAAVWGALALPMVAAPTVLASMVLAVMVAVTCCATFGLQVSRAATAAYVLPVTVAAMAALLARGDAFGRAGSAGLALLAVLQFVTAARSEQRLRVGLSLGWEAETMARDKDEALKQALRQGAVKAQFLANISHELRTPLHGILGIARLLRLDGLPPEAAHRVELIEVSGQHLLALINDLLDISRLEAGRFAMRSETFDLVAQIDHVAEVHAVRAQLKGLGFEVWHAIPAPCWRVGDPARFRQVLHNLLGNAIKFTERGAVTLEVELERAPGRVDCRVVDSGSGIAAADLEHIFEAFRQMGRAASTEPGQATSTEPVEGTGLGLTIARDIARSMGGDVTVQSTLGLGTTLHFSARLPPAAAPVRRQAAVSTAGAGPTRPHAPGSEPMSVAGPTPPRCTALLAEDDDVNALIAGAYLERFGVAVERVVNGAAALAAALRSACRPDFVLMDCRMPVMDGFEATRRLRAAEAAEGLARLPVIALTATAGDEYRQQCLAAGMDDFLAKPFTPEELGALVDRWAAGGGALPSHNPASFHAPAPHP